MTIASFLTREQSKRTPSYNKHKGILENGKDNDYPSEVERVISQSSNASQCADIYANFIAGKGFATTEVNLSEFSWQYYNQNDLLKDIAESISRHQGAYIHVNYNANYEKAGFAALPYENCRISKLDSQGYNAYVYHDIDSWTGYRFKDNSDTVSRYHSYNPNPDIIAEQVELAGGIAKYNGQIYYLKLSDKYAYTDPLIARAWESAKSDYELNLYYLNTIRNSFHDPIVVRHKPLGNKKATDKLEKVLKEAIGARNAGSIIRLEDSFGVTEPEGNFKIEPIATDIKPEKFAHIETTIANKIRKAYKNIPPQLTDFIQGKLGATSGEDLTKATAIYNQQTASDREKIERAFSELFRNFHRDIGNDWTIDPYEILSTGTIA